MIAQKGEHLILPLPRPFVVRDVAKRQIRQCDGTRSPIRIRTAGCVASGDLRLKDVVDNIGEKAAELVHLLSQQFDVWTDSTDVAGRMNFVHWRRLPDGLPPPGPNSVARIRRGAGADVRRAGVT